MKRFITFSLAVFGLSATTLSTVACGVSPGELVKINIDAPKQAKEGEDPLAGYVFNNKYSFDETLVKLTIARAAQLVSDRIKKDQTEQKEFNSEEWKKFYNSDSWKVGSFASFNYDLKDYPEKAFAFRAKDEKDLIYFIKNNDPTKDDNKLRSYWFITSAKSWEPGKESDYQPTKNNIEVPKEDEFTKDKPIISRTGFVHFYLEIGNFRIDFNALLTFNFKKFVKGSDTVILLDQSTFEPFASKITDPDQAYEKFINGVYISEKN